MNYQSLMSTEAALRYYQEGYYRKTEKALLKQEEVIEDRKNIRDILSAIRNYTTIVDIGCGDCKWFYSLENKTDHYHGLDQVCLPGEMLPKNSKFNFHRANIFSIPGGFLAKWNNSETMLLASFVLSHFTNDLIEQLLNQFNHVQQILIIDSAWTPAVAMRGLSAEIQMVNRKTNDGTDIQIPKRFFVKEDLQRIASNLTAKITAYQTFNRTLICQLERV